MPNGIYSYNSFEVQISNNFVITNVLVAILAAISSKENQNKDDFYSVFDIGYLSMITFGFRFGLKSP